MSKGHSLQDPYLNTLRKEKVGVSIYLVNGIKLQGTIESFDQFVILLKNTVSQMVSGSSGTSSKAGDTRTGRSTNPVILAANWPGKPGPVSVSGTPGRSE